MEPHDQKSYVMMAVATMLISESIVHLHPQLLPLHDADPDLPLMLRCSTDKLADDGAYLLGNDYQVLHNSKDLVVIRIKKILI